MLPVALRVQFNSWQCALAIGSKPRQPMSMFTGRCPLANGTDWRQTDHQGVPLAAPGKPISNLKVTTRDCHSCTLAD